LASVRPHKVMVVVWHEPERFVETGTAACAKSGNTTGGYTPQDYVGMWQRTVNVIRKYYSDNGYALNVKFGIYFQNYPPNDWCSAGSMINSLYPGDSYVDWVGWDDYVSGGSMSGQSWTDVNDRFYNFLTSNSTAGSNHVYTNKPWFISEMGINATKEGVAASETWYSQAATAIKSNTYPNIRAIVPYDDYNPSDNSGAGGNEYREGYVGGYGNNDSNDTYSSSKQSAFNAIPDAIYSTVTSTSTNPPTINSFSVSPTTVVAGNTAKFSWSTTNTQSCSLNPGGPQNSTATSWTSPALTTLGTFTYTLSCVSSGASTSKTTTVTVSPVLPPSGSGHKGPIVGTELNGMCADNKNGVKALFNPVVLNTCDGSGSEQWTFNTDGTVVNTNGYCLDVKGDATTIETAVDIYSCNGTKAQIWKVNITNHTITSPHSGLCLDDKSALATTFNEVWMYTCNGTKAQYWKTPLG